MSRRGFLAWTLKDAKVGHRSGTIGQRSYIACQLGRKLTWNSAAEQFVGDEEANRLARGKPGRAPWSVTWAGAASVAATAALGDTNPERVVFLSPESRSAPWVSAHAEFVPRT